jgi:hypothetical protein
MITIHTLKTIIDENYYIHSCIQKISKKYNIHINILKNILYNIFKTKPIYNIDIISDSLTYQKFYTLKYNKTNRLFPKTILDQITEFSNNNNGLLISISKNSIKIKYNDLRQIIYYLLTGNTLHINCNANFLLSNVKTIPIFTGKSIPNIFNPFNPNYIPLIWYDEQQVIQKTPFNFDIKCVIINTNTLFYRGSNSYPIKYGRWYTHILENALIYIKKGGYLDVFTIKEHSKMFLFDNISNINTLYKYFFETGQIKNYNLIKIVTGYPILNYGKIINIRGKDEQFDFYHGIEGDKIVNSTTTDITPVQIKCVTRQSDLEFDIMFLSWLCDNGFDGYCHGFLKCGIRICSDFYPEIALCNPFDMIHKSTYIFNSGIKDKRVIDYIKNQQ